MIAAVFKAVGDCALLVEFGSQEDEALNRLIITLDRVISEAGIPGVRETVPALVNLLVVFDPVETDHVEIEAAIQGLLPLPDAAQDQATHHDVPVCFDPELTPDLQDVAKACNMRIDEVVDVITQTHLKVAMYGFAPGYAYLTGVPERLRVPRKQTPKPDVPKGSILMAGAQSIITPLTMPTGWSIIGRSAFEVMQTQGETSFRFQVGDTIRYRAIGRSDLPSELLAV
ncbi:allophanate hydrolase subunit 1 [Gymnodinialimonas hymeniacidonis]|uniref:5-oxoprolinase subunit B family protein n=1 Tax=Gymnodinialimonas hymeniacidonis TaxID=3126508 RepID=UPI0034C62ABB